MSVIYGYCIFGKMNFLLKLPEWVFCFATRDSIYKVLLILV